MAELVLTRTARQDLQALPPALQAAVSRAIDRIALQPRAAGVPLLGRLRGRWSTRVGTYRIVYSVDQVGGRELIVVRSIRHRGVAYGRRRR